MLVQSLGREDPLEQGMATHSSILTWRILGTEESGGYNPWGCKESDWTDMHTHSLCFIVTVLFFFFIRRYVI